MRISPEVEISMRDKSAHFHGLARCGSVWECPVCQMAIKAERADEVRAVVTWHGQGRTYLVTVTVAHGLGDDLRVIRKGVARAWQKLQQGAPWKRMCERYGFLGFVRALETTHGKKNGFHPHLHSLFFLRQLTPAERDDLAAWLSDRWRTMVCKVLGAEHRPSEEHGCDVRVCRKADYIAKLGLEISAPGTKSARGGNRTPLEVAADFVETGDADDLETWERYCGGMRGARMLTWSRGLREAAGLDVEKTDEEIVEGEGAEEELVAVIPGDVWDAIRDIAGAEYSLLAAAETGGAPAVRALVAQYLARHGAAPP